MATYIQIRDRVKQRYGFVSKTCWIADVKYQCGLPMRQAPNRKGVGRLYPCPQEKKAAILDALRHFGMIG
jgi:hypothetical protein